MVGEKWRVVERRMHPLREGGTVRNAKHYGALWLSALLIVGAGLLAGCKSAPPLTQDQALKMIQAYYDQQPPAGIHIVVNDLGMRQGITAKYWNRTLVYPNRIWADFKLTDEGKKVVALPRGGDVIQWRPDTANDSDYSVVVVTVKKNHLKPHDIGTVQSEILPGVKTARGASFVEGVDMDGIPQPLQDIAHNPGNQLSSRRQADFALEDGVWKLHGVQ